MTLLMNIIQILSIIVDYLASLWRALFSVDALELDIPWKKYMKDVEAAELYDSGLDTICQIAWGSLLDPSVVEKRQAHLSMLTPKLMAALEELTANLDIRELLLREPSTSKLYAQSVASICAGEIFGKSFSNENERHVRIVFRAKLEWLLSDHVPYHYQGVLPLLTPSIIVGLADILNQIPNACAEVSHIFCKYNPFHIVIRIGLTGCICENTAGRNCSNGWILHFQPIEQSRLAG